MSLYSLYYTDILSPIGQLQLVAKQQQLVYLGFEVESLMPEDHWQKQSDYPVFLQTKLLLQRYFSGEPETFQSLPIRLHGTVFQQNVWQLLRQIPYGTTLSYADIAKRLNQPKAMRAVGNAVGKNPLSIIVPCHRVLGKHQALTGFGGGLMAKRYLLQLENITYLDKGVEWVKPKPQRYIK